MRIMSFNVNGLNSFSAYITNYLKININTYFTDIFKVDILCIQETKGSKEKLAQFVNLKDYKAFFSYNKIRNGHAGVCIYVKKNLYVRLVKTVFTNTDVKMLNEGRIIFLDCGNFRIVNIYFPYYDEEVSPSEEKFNNVCKFYDYVFDYLQDIDDCVVVGDFNAVYMLKDHYQFLREYKRIKKAEEIKRMENNGNHKDGIKSKFDIKNNNHTDYHFHYDIEFPYGETKITKFKKSQTELSFYFKFVNALSNYFFEKWQRAWMRKFINCGNVIDCWNHFYQNCVKYTCWNQILNLRPENLGTRIDYVFVSKSLIDKVQKCEILNDIYGSDHRSIYIDIDLEILKGDDNVVNKKSGIFVFVN